MKIIKKFHSLPSIKIDSLFADRLGARNLFSTITEKFDVVEIKIERGTNIDFRDWTSVE